MIACPHCNGIFSANIPPGSLMTCPKCRNDFVIPDPMDTLIDEVRQQTAALNRIAMSAEERDEKARKLLRDLRAPLRDLRILACLFMFIFIINGCYQTWSVKFQTSAAKNPSASSAAAVGSGSSTSR